MGNRLRLNYGKSPTTIRADDGNIPIYGTGGLVGYGKKALCGGDSVLIGRKGTLDRPIYIAHPFWPVDTTYYTSDFSGSIKWLYYLIQTIDLSSLNEATGVPSLSRQTFYNIEVLFPPLEEQIAIADILTTVDQAIEQTEALIAKQRRIRAGLLHDLLTRGIDENGQLRDPATHRFKPSPVGLVPAEWEVTSFEALIESAIDGPFGSNLKTEHYVQDNGVRVVRLQNIGAGQFQDGDKAFVSRKHAQRLNRHEVLPGDLLVAALGDSKHPIGRACLFPNGFPPAINKADCFRIRLKPALALHGFVMCVLNSPVVRAQIEGLGQGVTRDRVNLTKMRSIVLPKPPLAEQYRIHTSMIHQDDLVIDLEAQMDKYHHLKTGLMQDLLGGRVSVAGLMTDKTSFHRDSLAYTPKDRM